MDQNLRTYNERDVVNWYDHRAGLLPAEARVLNQYKQLVQTPIFSISVLEVEELPATWSATAAGTQELTIPSSSQSCAPRNFQALIFRRKMLAISQE